MEQQTIIPPGEIIQAYRNGYFPMAESARADADVFWYTARKRGIIPLESFHISKRSLRYFNSFGYRPELDKAFEHVIDGCASRDSTWINPVIKNTFCELHRQGLAHSVEVWKDSELVGGLYGIALGGAFFAESVFQSAPEAHKAAIYFCYRQLKQQQFGLWDVQFHTPHLEQFGCTEISGGRYRKLLAGALRLDRRFDGRSDENLI